MTLRKDFPDKLVPVSEKNSGITVETLNKLNRLCSRLIAAGISGCNRDALKKELEVSSLNTVDRYLKELASFLKVIFPDDYENYGLEQSKDGREFIYRFRNAEMILKRLGGQSFNSCLVARSLNFAGRSSLESFSKTSDYARELKTFSLKEAAYLKLSHTFACEIALNDLGYAPEGFIYCDNSFEEITSVLETAGRIVHFRQLCSLEYADSKEDRLISFDYFVPIALVRSGSIEITELKDFESGKIVLLGLHIGSRTDSALRQALEGRGQYSVYSSDLKNNLTAVDITTVTSLVPLLKGGSRITYTLQADANTDVFFCSDSGDLMNLQGLPFSIEVYDIMLDTEKMLYPDTPNDWLVGHDAKTSDEKLMELLKEISDFEIAEDGSFVVPEGLEYDFLRPKRLVFCINYISLMAMMHLCAALPEDTSLPAFMRRRFKRIKRRC